MDRKLKLVFVLLSLFVLAGCNIEGQVVSYDGAGIAGITVLLTGDVTSETVTDNEGYYQFIDLDQGNYVVTPQSSEYNFIPESKSVAITDATATGVDFIAAPEDALLVPQEYPTIQDAVDVAVDNSLVLIGDGTYSGPGNFNIDVAKAIVIRSLNGPRKTIIDCQQSGRGFHLKSDATLHGLSITNGSYYRGGAMEGTNISPNIVNCHIYNNYGRDGGGGLYFTGGRPRIENCIITQNTTDGGGGGMSFTSGLPVVVGSTIAGNHAQQNGGGIYGYSITLQNCIVRNNRSETNGGGAYLIQGSDKIITNCLFADNIAVNEGGGLYIIRGQSIIYNNTIAGNTSITGGNFASGFCLAYSSDNGHEISNTIVWGNDGKQMSVNYAEYSLSFSNIGQDGFSGDGVINEDPLFEDDDYRLSPGSPCIDTGTDTGLASDLDGVYRPQGNGFDMGAYESIAN